MFATCTSARKCREIGFALLAYAVVLIASVQVVAHFKPPSPLKEILTLSPMVPGIFLIWAVLRQRRRLDELQCRVQMEALSFAFVGTVFLTFSYGLLEGVGYPRMSSFVVLPMMAVLGIVGQIFASRRYR